MLGALYEQARAAGLLSEPAPTRVRTPARDLEAPRGGSRGGAAGWHLAALFDVALEGGRADAVARYVREVCHDAFAVSANATEAYLVDGAAVADWARDYLAALEKEVEGALRALSSSSDWHAAADRLHRAWLRAVGLGEVLGALLEGPGMAPAGAGAAGAAGGGAGAGAAPGQEVQEGLRRCGGLQAAAGLLLWCLLEGLHKHRSCPAHHASAEAWAGAVAAGGGAAAADGGRWSYRQHLLDAMGSGAAAYPPRSLVEAVWKFVLPAAAAGGEAGGDKAGEDAGRRLFLYYLLDLGVGEALQDGYAAQFGLSPEDVGEIRGAWLLDGGGDGKEVGEGGRADLDAGCDLLCTVAGPRTPLGLARLMLQQGRAEQALYLVAVREHRILGDGGALALADAEVGLEVRLAGGRLHEASLAAQSHLEELPAGSPERRQAAQALTRRLCDWSLGARQLHRLVELPLLPEQERALEAACREWAARGEANCVQWVLFLLLRDRVVEASSAFAALEAAVSSGGSGMDTTGPEVGRALQRCREMLRIAEGQLPDVQRRLLIREAGPPAAPGGRPAPLVRVVPAAQAAAAEPGPRLRVAAPASGAPAPFQAPALR